MNDTNKPARDPGCHGTAERLLRRDDGRLTPSEREEFAVHLSRCEACQSLADDHRRATEALRSLAPGLAFRTSNLA